MSEILSPPLPPRARVALILGAAVWPHGPSPTLRRRTAHAIALYQTGKIDMIMGCGGLGQNPPTEAEAVAQLCRDAGLPAHAILLEDRSTTTRENLFNAKALLPPGARVIIVTDPYHAPRAQLIARQIGLNATADTPGWQSIGPRQRLKHIPREAFGLLFTYLRLR